MNLRTLAGKKPAQRLLVLSDLPWSRLAWSCASPSYGSLCTWGKVSQRNNLCQSEISAQHVHSLMSFEPDNGQLFFDFCQKSHEANHEISGLNVRQKRESPIALDRSLVVHMTGKENEASVFPAKAGFSSLESMAEALPRVTLFDNLGGLPMSSAQQPPTIGDIEGNDSQPICVFPEENEKATAFAEALAL